LFLAAGTLCPNVKSVFIECHRWVEGRPVDGDEFLGWFNEQVTLGVIEEGKRDSIFIRIHNHPVLHALVDGIAQYLYKSILFYQYQYDYENKVKLIKQYIFKMEKSYLN
jgi:hypothetical protein